MTRNVKSWRAAASVVLLLAALAAAAPHFRADGFRPRIQDSLERALGRKVDMGQVRLSLLTGPAFSAERVVIHDHPAIGIEPLAYVNLLTARLSLWSLLRGRVEFSSVMLE